VATEVDRHPRQTGTASEDRSNAHAAAGDTCRPHRDRTVRDGVEVVNGPVSWHPAPQNRCYQPCSKRYLLRRCRIAGPRRTAVLSVRRDVADMSSGVRRPSAGRAPAAWLSAWPAPMAHSVVVTGWARMIAVGDKSPVFAHYVKHTAGAPA
jgi:hypothetical protein